MGATDAMAVKHELLLLLGAHAAENHAKARILHLDLVDPRRQPIALNAGVHTIAALLPYTLAILSYRIRRLPLTVENDKATTAAAFWGFLGRRAHLECRRALAEVDARRALAKNNPS